MRLLPSSKTAMLLVKLFLRASASAALPISLAAASVSDFFVVSRPMCPSLFLVNRLRGCRSAAQRNHVEGVLRRLNGGGELVAVDAASLHATFPLDRRLDEGIGLTARWDSNLVVEQFGNGKSQLLFDGLQRLHEGVVAAVA